MPKQGLFLPTTNIYHVQNANIDQELKELLLELYQSINNIALAVNQKETGLYSRQEYISGKSWFRDPNLDSTSARQPIHRSVYRKVIDFGALPNNSTRSVAHGITMTPNIKFTHIYGVANENNKNWFLPLPYIQTSLASVIAVRVNPTHVQITTGTDRSMYTGFVVLEYIKQ